MVSRTAFLQFFSCILKSHIFPFVLTCLTDRFAWLTLFICLCNLEWYCCWFPEITIYGRSQVSIWFKPEFLKTLPRSSWHGNPGSEVPRLGNQVFIRVGMMFTFSWKLQKRGHRITQKSRLCIYISSNFVIKWFLFKW